MKPRRPHGGHRRAQPPHAAEKQVFARRQSRGRRASTAAGLDTTEGRLASATSSCRPDQQLNEIIAALRSGRLLSLELWSVSMRAEDVRALTPLGARAATSAARRQPVARRRRRVRGGVGAARRSGRSSGSASTRPACTTTAAARSRRRCAAARRCASSGPAQSARRPRGGRPGSPLRDSWCSRSCCSSATRSATAARRRSRRRPATCPSSSTFALRSRDQADVGRLAGRADGEYIDESNAPAPPRRRRGARRRRRRPPPQKSPSRRSS